MKEPKISIIVPVYNTARYLEKCLDSILGQTYRNLEVILVNDGSTDGSKLICDKYKINDKRVKVIHKVNEGVSIARNTGIEIATGDFFSFIDSDDYLATECYQKVVDILNSEDCDVVMFDYLLTYPDREVRHKTPQKYIGQLDVSDILEVILLSIAPFACTKVFSAECCKDIRFKNTIHLGEDSIFVYEAVKNAKKIFSIPDNLLHYVQSENSATRSRGFNVKLMTGINMVNYFIDVCQANYPKSLYAAKTKKINMLASLSFESISLSKNSAIRKTIRRECKNTFNDCLFQGGIPLKYRIKLFLLTLFPRVYFYNRLSKVRHRN